MRMIDADATKRRVADTYFDTLIPCVNRALDDSPTVDAVHVVRCMECKHIGFCGDATNLEVMGFYGYCSRGERKEGAD